MNTKKHWITLSMLQGHIAMWAVRQSPYKNPDGLGSVLEQFKTNVLPAFDVNEMRYSDAHDVRTLVELYLFSIPQVMKWNERKNGNQSPLGFCSRYDKPDPDNDFIDLYALSNNIGRSLMAECRAEDNAIAQPIRTTKWLWLKRIFSKPPVPTIATPMPS
jgi:hypothetical protein